VHLGFEPDRGYLRHRPFPAVVSSLTELYNGVDGLFVPYGLLTCRFWEGLSARFRSCRREQETVWHAAAMRLRLVGQLEKHIPQRLKAAIWSIHGAAEATPFQDRFKLVHYTSVT